VRGRHRSVYISFDVLEYAGIITSQQHSAPGNTLQQKVHTACANSAFGLRNTIADRTYVYKQLPNVNPLLEQLATNSLFRIALLTGNYAVNAKLKLQGASIQTHHFQYNPQFSGGLDNLVIDDNCDPIVQQKDGALLGSFGSDHRVRRNLPPIARDRFSDLIGHTDFDGIIIGDTPKDIDCAHFNGMKAIGVATGPYTEAQLAAAGADATLPDFSDINATIETFLSV